MERLLSEFRTKKIFIIPIVIIVVFLIVRTILLQKPSTDIPYAVKRENLVDTVVVSGTYTTASQTQVMSPTNGVITQLYVTNGSIVKKGDPLFHVESIATTDQQNIAYAAYQSAVSSLQTTQNNVQSLDAAMWAKQQAYISAQNTQNYMNNNTTNPATKQSYTDLEKLAINNAVTQTQKDFQAAEQAYTTANVAVSAAQAQVTATKQAYQETQSTTVIAPTSGKVANLLVNAGDQVTALQPTMTPISGAAQPILVIGNFNDPYISVNIGEDYATRVTAGQNVSIVFDSLKNQTFTGKVADIATVGTTSEGVVTYAARISAQGLPLVIKPDMTALVTIETLRKDNVIDVPNSALVTNDGNTYVVAAQTHKQITVVPGTRGVAKTEITSGLDEGTVIVANPN